MKTLNNMNVGDVVKINENGVAVNFIIIHKGMPSGIYDFSCDGVWVLRQSAYAARAFNSSDYNNYEESSINYWLNNGYLAMIGSEIRELINTVKIPYKKGTGDSTSKTVQTGSNGLSCKVFLLSGNEVGLTSDDDEFVPKDGAKLAYFLNGASDAAAMKKRVCANNVGWWLRSPYTENSFHVWCVANDGRCSDVHGGGTGVYSRPAFILPYNLFVDLDGNVTTDLPPTITSDKTGDLGKLTSGFTCHYSVNDTESSSNVTVTLALDDKRITQFNAVKQRQETYTLGGEDWLKITNGSHTFKISASDGKSIVTSTAVFSRDQTELSAALSEPLAADDRITACFLNVEGSYPFDAVHKYEVTNNALDDEPVWEDCTARVKAGLNYMFGNSAAENGFAFSFRIKISRGASGVGGYITKISGGFE